MTCAECNALIDPLEADDEKIEWDNGERFCSMSCARAHRDWLDAWGDQAH